MEKVLVFNDGVDEVIHYIEGKFISASKTLCGIRLHPINTIHMRKLSVTCEECKKLIQKSSVKGE